MLCILYYIYVYKCKKPFPKTFLFIVRVETLKNIYVFCYNKWKVHWLTACQHIFRFAYNFRAGFPMEIISPNRVLGIIWRCIVHYWLHGLFHLNCRIYFQYLYSFMLIAFFPFVHFFFIYFIIYDGLMYWFSYGYIMFVWRDILYKFCCVYLLSIYIIYCKYI